MGCGASTAASPAAAAPATEQPAEVKDPASAIVATAPKEAPAGPVHPKVSKIFSIIDKDGNGSLSKKEILIALRKSEEVRAALGLDAVKFEGSPAAEAFEAAFAKLDIDGNDSVNEVELNAFLGDWLDGMGSAPVPEPVPEPVPVSDAPPAETATGEADAPSPPAAAEKQSALVFAKPHANTAAVREMISSTFASKGISILSEGEIGGEAIDADKLIDQHYYAIASKATIMPGSELPVPADKFAEKFGEEWEAVKAESRAFNALEMCAKLEIDAAALNVKWKAAEADGMLVKFGGGFYCAKLAEGDASLYVFNAFFMSMRGKFTAPGSSIHYYVVEFDPAGLPWADFRGSVLGPTDPAKAPETSLRGMMNLNWEALGLAAAPNTTDNGVHASASPFEGLAERMNWLKVAIADDPFGKKLLAAGISAETISKWSVDPRVPLPGADKPGSLFDALEDLDLDACVAKAVEINAVGA